MMLCAERERRAGFTLIEIMIVIAIIAILAGIMVPNFVQAREEAKYQKCLENCKLLVKVAVMVSVRHSPREIVRMNDKSWRDRGMWGSFSEKDYDAGGGYLYYIDEFVLMDYGYVESMPMCPTSGKWNEYDIVWAKDIGDAYCLPQFKSFSGWVSDCFYGEHRMNGKDYWPFCIEGVGICKDLTWSDLVE